MTGEVPLNKLVFGPKFAKRFTRNLFKFKLEKSPCKIVTLFLAHSCKTLTAFKERGDNVKGTVPCRYAGIELKDN
jgi:hypothetical protein